RTASKELGITIGIMQDISGPKIRIGDIKDTFELHSGDVITFVPQEIVGYKESSNSYVVSINYPDILSKVQMDDYIYLYDGAIRAKVIHTVPHLVAVVENHGILTSKKGVNFPNTVIDIDVITTKDAQDIEWGVRNQVDFFAISFVQNRQDMINARNLLGSYDGRLIAKIEKFEAVENVDEILDVSDGIIVARGDLGIEVPFYQVPIIQKMLIDKANQKGKPVITATQMLLSMTQNERPTRAEISDVANAVLDGTDVVMLSEESAIGIDPVNVVKAMSSIIEQTETIYPFGKQEIMAKNDSFDIIQASATKLADDINSKGILALTGSGSSAIKIARYRPKTPIFAFSKSDKTLRRLTVSWGILPIATIEDEHKRNIYNKILHAMDKLGTLDIDGPYIATIGHPIRILGSTNAINILNKQEICYYMRNE
ncbi:MAG: pyruvate kinase, partial [Campylobacterales bacterium]|nr:pyruvate kinase [Campylobacterales bacterium]